MKKNIVEKIVSLASAAEKLGQKGVAAKLDKLAERLIVKAEMAATVGAGGEQLSKEDRVARMHGAINAMLKGLADSYVAKYGVDHALPKAMKIAQGRALKNSELVEFMKGMGFEYKTWNQMWAALGKFNTKFTRALNSNRQPFAVGPDFMGAGGKVDIGSPSVVENGVSKDTAATQTAEAPNVTVKPEAGKMQDIPDFSTKPTLPGSDWTTRK